MLASLVCVNFSICLSELCDGAAYGRTMKNTLRRVSIGTGDPAQEFAYLRRPSNPLKEFAALRSRLADSFSEISAQFSFKNQLPLVSLTEEWTSIHDLVMAIFRNEKIHPTQVCSVRQCIRLMLSTDIGSFIADYYTTRLLPQGITILNKKMENVAADEYIEKLANTWNNFYTRVIPGVDGLFYDVTPKNNTIRNRTLLKFRDHLVLNKRFEDYVHETLNAHNGQHTFSPAIVQMVLVLQSVRETANPSPALGPTPQALRLEALTSCIVTPYLGYLGLYEVPGKPPTIKANNRLQHRTITGTGSSVLLDAEQDAGGVATGDLLPSHGAPLYGSSPKVATKKRHHFLPTRQLSSGTLAPVLEQTTSHTHTASHQGHPPHQGHPRLVQHRKSATGTMSLTDSDDSNGSQQKQFAASASASTTRGHMPHHRRRHSLQSVSSLLEKIIS